MKKNNFFTLNFDSDFLHFIDQTKLPGAEVYVDTDSVERIAEAIEKLEIRGAPAIGIAAAYAVALSLKNKTTDTEKLFNDAYKRLAKTRPTAVNLFWALNEMQNAFRSISDKQNPYDVLLKKAEEIHAEDFDKCKRISENGLAIFKKKSVVLTHCNAGALATGGIGTAIGVIANAYNKGLVEKVYADETRPLFQGLRLTAFELDKLGIPFTLQIDSAAAVLMQKKVIDLVITGADRIAKNGDAANKIGTYSLAALCSFHKIPFYIAAPTSTIDKHTASGDDIEVELRSKDEIIKNNNINISLPEYDVFTPAFDVTPNSLISGIITEEKLHYPPYSF